MTTYGYVRVSTREQNEERQLIAMEEFGVMSSCIVLDKQSGRDFERPGYRRLLRRLKAGDTLVIKSIDRLGRDLTGVLIADIVLQLLSYVAQTEREFNRQRQAEGIAAAKARGVHFGRRFKDRGEHYGEILAAWRRGELSGRAAARALNVAHGTFQRWSREIDQ